MNNITLTLTKTGTQEQVDAIATYHGWYPASGVTSADFCLNYYSEMINRDLITVLLKPMVLQQEADRAAAGNALVEGLKTKTTMSNDAPVVVPAPVDVPVTPVDVPVDPVV